MIERKIIGMAPASRLGVVRMIVACAAILYVSMESLESFAEVSTVWFTPRGFLKLIPRELMESLLSSASNLAGLKILLTVSLLFSLLGFLTRPALMVSTVLFFLYQGVLYSYGTYAFHGMILLYLLFFLAYVPSGAGFSVDERLKQKGKRVPADTRPDEVMGWSVFLMRAVIAFSYFLSGWVKLTALGLMWLKPWSLKKFMIQDCLTLTHFNNSIIKHALNAPDAAWVGVTALMIGSALLFPVALISWEIRRIYPYFAALAAVVMYRLCPVSLPDLAAFLVLLLVFYDWDRVFLKGLLPVQDRRRR